MEVETTINEFSNVLFHSNLAEHERITEIIVILDKLAFLANTCQFEIDDRAFPDRPDRDFKKLYNKIGKRFPSLGLYDEATHASELVGSFTLVGDAIDDLADISGDLGEVKWRMENTSLDDALAHFRFLFRCHWGAHLRHLQLYLHLREVDHLKP
jgi:hypothetical protein